MKGRREARKEVKEGGKEVKEGMRRKKGMRRSE
jgi:hypothetical protein